LHADAEQEKRGQPRHHAGTFLSEEPIVARGLGRRTSNPKDRGSVSIAYSL
jgi:hypothetical protein